MKHFVTVAVVAGLLLGGCDKLTNPEDDRIPSEVVGSWSATAYIFTSKADTTQSVDLIQGGSTLELTINADGTYMFTFDFGDGEGVETGTMAFSGNQVTVSATGGAVDVATFSVSGSTLVVHDEEEGYDFNGDGVEEDARLRIVFEKQTTGEGGSVPTELVGSWDATGYLFINNADTTQQFDMVQAGLSFTLQITTNGSYTTTTTFEGTVETDTGTLSVTGNQVTVTPDDGSGADTAFYELSGGTLVVTIPDSEFDFDDDDILEPATVRLTMQKS